MRNIIYHIFSIALFLQALNPLGAQTNIQGKVFDEITGQSLIGVRFFYESAHSGIGTISNEEGFFELQVDNAPPFEIEVSFIGYQSRNITVEEVDQYVEVYLLPNDVQIEVQSRVSEAEVIAASKTLETRLSSPASVEKMGIIDIQALPTRDFYAGIGYLKGAFVNNSSFTYHSINTRGFANLQNWRFISLIDGMDISGPGVNYGVGTVMKGSELDIREIELIPGPGSALYGPNALNGLVSMSTKSPYSYQGLSAYIKQGMMNRPNNGSEPYTDLGIRYATTIGDRFAFKINMTYLTAQDWYSDDRSHNITNQTVLMKDQLLAKSPFDPNFDAVNVYGDDIQVPIDLGGDEPVLINRTGIPEIELLDYEINNLYLQGSLHYFITDDLEASYDIRYSRADNIIRYENFYPFDNFETVYQKLELKSKKFTGRMYMATDNSGDGYSVLAAGAIVQEALKPSSQWGAEYGAAYRGDIPGIIGNNHSIARQYADRDIPGSDSRTFQNAKDQTTAIPIDLPGGSGVSMKASFLHTDLLYNFSEEINVLDLQVGASYRRYVLDSEGHVYSDGPLGFNKPIPVWEYGIFAQAAKGLLNDRLNLRGSVRYDKNKNFQGRITPRLSAVGLLGGDKKHTIRASWQTGFRNPANQDTYVAFNAGPLIYLGNIEDNISNFGIQTPDGVIVSGENIYNTLVTQSSFENFVAQGANDPNLLQSANLNYLEQEQITTLELGYRAFLTDDLFLDVSFFRNSFDNFTANIVSFSPLINTPILTLNNVPDKVTSSGFNIGVDYENEAGWQFGGSYNYLSFNAEEALENNPFYFPDFNTPENSFKLYAGYLPLRKSLGFITHYRWLEDYLYQSPNTQGLLDGFGVWDAAILYRLPNLRSIIKLGATNITSDGYRTVYGGPTIGGEYYLQWTFDELLK